MKDNRRQPQHHATRLSLFGSPATHHSPEHPLALFTLYVHPSGPAYAYLLLYVYAKNELRNLQYHPQAFLSATGTNNCHQNRPHPTSGTLQNRVTSSMYQKYQYNKNINLQKKIAVA